MRFLYDAGRRLFGSATRWAGRSSSPAITICSPANARLASLVAIAKGDVPVEHWFALGRPLVSTAHGQDAAFLERHDVRIPDAAAVHANLHEFAARSCVPRGGATADRLRPRKRRAWGISESAYSALDANQIYQYRAFGVPALALKPGLEDDLVVAPYATMLALTVDPVTPSRTCGGCADLDLDGPMGFYESIDYSRENSATASAEW